MPFIQKSFFQIQIFKNWDTKQQIIVIARKERSQVRLGEATDVAIFRYNDLCGLQVLLCLHFEVFEDPNSAIEREKQIKNWSRKKKDKLIMEFNPDLKDLYGNIV